MYRVVQDLTVRVNGTIKTFHIGSIVNLPEKSAQIFVKQGKIVLAFNPVNALNERMAIMGENCEPEQTKPYVTSGVLVIPFNSDKKYHYWDGGQGVCDTLKELGRCDLIEKYKSLYSDN
jgi:hypothetical protein